MLGDFEWALATAIRDKLAEYDIVVTPVAGDLPDTLSDALVQVRNVGGTVINPGMIDPACQVHVYEGTENGARLLGVAVADALRILGDEQIVGDANIVAILPRNVPYPNPDPRNANHYRVSQTVQLIVKPS